ncbi:MAG: hypothetical protein A2018_00185 [Alphaproteobacteria bacterium GWF2_58_20]|nr:MAG: hypothetical protein A2018_00185 [Alphaproteobacteria bacterium GWF2_58_20]
MLLAGCGSSSLPDMRMPEIKLSSLWPSGQGLSAAAPAKTPQKDVHPGRAPVKAPPAVLPVPESMSKPGPTAQIQPVEMEMLPAPEAQEAAMPGWMRRSPEPSSPVIRFSAAETKPSLFAPVPSSGDTARMPVVPMATKASTFDGAPPAVRAALLVPEGVLGDAMRQAATLAVFDVQKTGFELRPYATGAGADGVSVAVHTALSEGASILLGPVFASDAVVAKPLAQAAGVPMVTFSTDWTLAGEGAYVFGFLPFTQVIRVLDHAGIQGIKRLAILAPAGTYGDAVVETARWQAAKLGMSISGIGRYDATPGTLEAAVSSISDFPERSDNLAAIRQQLQMRQDAEAMGYLAQLANARGFGPMPCDAVLVAQGGERLPEVLAAMTRVGLAAPQVHLMGTGLWDDPGLWSLPALSGAWFSAPAPGLRQEFMARYQQVFGDVPPRLATLAYDATALAMALSGTPLDAADLQSPDGFVGLDGIFRFRSNGLVERGLPVLEIRDGRPRVASPAPLSFRPAGR